jgi:hypothetical protein
VLAVGLERSIGGSQRRFDPHSLRQKKALRSIT